MSHRAGIILLQDDKVALIERQRAGLHYFTFPGGHVDPGETSGQTAVREAQEELGLLVELDRLVAKFRWEGDWQYYYLVGSAIGTFGTGRGEEMHNPLPERGSYEPVWMRVADLPDQPVMPPQLAALVVQCVRDGWPEEPVVIPEETE